MINRRKVLALGLACVPAVYGMGLLAAAGSEPDRAKHFIESLAEKAVNALAVKEISPEERGERFRKILDDNFAVGTIGQWVLGKYWRNATESERKEYLELFKRLMIATYADRFANYSGETLSVLRSVPLEDRDILVSSQIVSPGGGEPISVNWRVREHDGTFKIIDVIVAGVSMGQTQRSEFGSVIRDKGGSVAGLIEELRKRVGSGG